MATQQLQLLCDSSTLANFKAWAQPVSNWFRSCGYTNTSDTGQVNWSTIAAVPGSGAFVYEIFQSNDSYTQFFAKVEYGNVTSATNCPTVRITLGTGSNGSGTLTGFVTTALLCHASTYTPPSTTTQYECDFSGDSANSRIGAMMWRNAPANQGQMLFAIERSVNSSGAYTSSYVTLWTVGSNAGIVSGNQQSLVFGVGAAPPLLSRQQAGSGTLDAGVCARAAIMTATATSSAFNGSIPFDTCAPVVGLFDYECTMLGVAWGTDYAEGIPFNLTLYSETRTYMPSKLGAFNVPMFCNGGNLITCLRYD